MFSELVLESEPEDYNISDDFRKIMDLKRTSSEFMLHLLEELLDVVKIESGKLDPEANAESAFRAYVMTSKINYRLCQRTDIVQLIGDRNVSIRFIRFMTG